MRVLSVNYIFCCCVFFFALNQWKSPVIGEQKTLKNKTLGVFLGGAGGRCKKIELPILRRYSGGSDGGPKSGIVYTTARFWWFQWMTKKWNRLYYGEIVVAPMNDQKVKLLTLRWDPGGWKIEFPILRRDLGFSHERAKNGITYATARSWGGPKSPKSLTIDGSIEKPMKNYEKKDETLMQHAVKWWKTAENRWNLMKNDETQWPIVSRI